MNAHSYIKPAVIYICGYKAERILQLKNLTTYCKANGFGILKIFEAKGRKRFPRKVYIDMIRYIKTQKCKIAIITNNIREFSCGTSYLFTFDELRKKDLIEIHFCKNRCILHKNSPFKDTCMWNPGLLLFPDRISIFLKHTKTRKYKK